MTYRNFGVKLDYSPNDRTQTFGRLGFFREKRDNGKISTFEPFTEEANDTRLTTVSGGVRWRLADESQLSATIYSDVETFRSNFMAVVQGTPVPRSVGRMTLNQRVPTNSVGGMVEWSRTLLPAGTTSPPAPTGDGRTATARKTPSIRLPARASSCIASRAAPSGTSARSSRT